MNATDLQIDLQINQKIDLQTDLKHGSPSLSHSHQLSLSLSLSSSAFHMKSENCQAVSDAHGSVTPLSRYLLCTTRILSFVYILGVSVITNFITQGSQRADWFIYFTYWNCLLLSIYFFLASSFSILGLLVKDTDRIAENYYVGLLGKSVHSLFEVCGSSGMLVTVIAFNQVNAVSDQHMDIWNISTHLVTLGVILLEMSLNNFYVRFLQYPINLAWGIAYLIFVWSYVYYRKEEFQDWPYTFLETENSSCLFLYLGLFILNIAFFVTWYCISEFKFWIRKKFESTLL